MKLSHYRFCEMQLVESTKVRPHYNISLFVISHKLFVFILGIIVFIAFLLLHTPPTGTQSLLEQTERLIQPANLYQRNILRMRQHNTLIFQKATCYEYSFKCYHIHFIVYSFRIRLHFRHFKALVNNYTSYFYNGWLFSCNCNTFLRLYFDWVSNLDEMACRFLFCLKSVS